MPQPAAATDPRTTVPLSHPLKGWDMGQARCPIGTGRWDILGQLGHPPARSASAHQGPGFESTQGGYRRPHRLRMHGRQTSASGSGS